MAFSPDGTRIVTGSCGRHGEGVGRADGHDSCSNSRATRTRLRACRSARTARASSPAVADRTAKVWDARTGTAAARPEGPHRTGDERVVQPGRSRSSPAVGTRTAKVWDCGPGAPCSNSKGTRTTYRAWRSARTARGSSPVATTRRRRCGTRGRHAPARTEGQPTVGSVSFSPDGTRIVTGSEDGTARVWDARTGTALLELKGHTGAMCRACRSARTARGSSPAVATRRRRCGTRTGYGPARTEGPHRRVLRACRSAPDGTRIVTVGLTCGTRRREGVGRTDGDPLCSTLKGRTEIDGAAFSPDGMRIVTGESDGDGEGVGLSDGESPAGFRADTRADSSAVIQPGRHPGRCAHRRQ